MSYGALSLPAGSIGALGVGGTPSTPYVAPSAVSSVGAGSAGTSLGASLAGAGLSAGIGLFSNIISNYLNARQNQKQLDFQREMMEKQMWYNSPIHQREMLEQAGYAPSALLDGVKAQGVGGSTPNVIPMQSYQPTDYFNNALNSLFQRLSVQKSLEEKDVDIAQKEFNLGLDRDTRIDLQEKRRFDTQYMQFEATLKAVEAELMDKFGERKMKAGIAELENSASLLKERENTEKGTQALYNAYKKLAEGRDRREQQQIKAIISRLWAEVGSLKAQTRLSNANAAYQENYNINYSHFGYSLMESAMNQAFQTESNLNLLANKFREEAKNLEKQNMWFEAQMVMSLGERATNVARNMNAIQNSNLSTDLKRDYLNLEREKFEKSLSDDERTIVDKYFDDKGNLFQTHTRYKN